MRIIHITNFETWKTMGEHYGFDPYKQVDHSIDKGGGNSMDWEYTGDIPKVCGNCLNCEKQIGGDGYCLMLRAGVFLDESCPQNSFVPKEE